jgi:hypothetical protein
MLLELIFEPTFELIVEFLRVALLSDELYG